MKKFPFVLVTGTAKNSYFGVTGLELESVMKADLLSLNSIDIDEKSSEVTSQLAPQSHILDIERFLHAIAPCMDDVVLELRFLGLPNLRVTPQGKILVSILLNTAAKSPEVVQERLISRYLQLAYLIKASFHTVEFVPIFEKSRLELRVDHLKAKSAFSIGRQNHKLSLNAPEERLTVSGFGKIAQSESNEATVIDHRFPFQAAPISWGKLFHSILGQLDSVEIIIRIRSAVQVNGYKKDLQKAILSCDQFLATVSKHQKTLEDQAKAVRTIMLKQLSKISQTAFDVGVFLQSPHEKADITLVRMLGRSISSTLDSLDMQGIFMGGFVCKKMNVKMVKRFNYFPEKVPFTITEAAAAFRVPASTSEPLPGLKEKQFRTRLAELPDAAQILNPLFLANNIHQGVTQPIQISLKDRMRHAFIVGQTGTGKSTLMESMILQDIYAGHGLAVIDPHGDMVDNIIGKIPKRRHKDVVLFDLLDRQHPVAFNILECDTASEMDCIIDNIYETLDDIYDMNQTGGPIFETHLRNTLKLLMCGGDRKNYRPTLLDFVLTFQNKNFREWLKDTVSDKEVRNFIIEADRTGGEARLRNLSPYITSKFGRFVNDTSLKRIIGQEKSLINFDDIMNTGKIFLVNLGKGRFGSTVAALLANQLVARFKMAAMKRGDMPEKKRRPFFLYVDEAHNLPPENFISLYSEARKYNLGLVLSTQYCAQLTQKTTGGDNLLSAILGNVGSILAFRLGTLDANVLAPFFHPYFNELDIIGLPNFMGYSKMQISNSATFPFSFESVMDKTVYSRKTARAVRQISRRKYSRPVYEVDKTIDHHRCLAVNRGGDFEKLLEEFDEE